MEVTLQPGHKLHACALHQAGRSKRFNRFALFKPFKTLRSHKSSRNHDRT